jgi:hyperosmotically inducible protein
MKRNGLIKLLILVAALNYSGCGGAANSAGGDSKTASASTGVNAASPTPTAESVASAVATPAAAPAATVSAGDAAAAARQGSSSTSPTSETRNANSAPQAKMPKPQIGSGGNDLFLFTQARAAINNDADLKAANVVVDVKEGVVTLSGTVASAALKSKAEELARGVGPKDVKNQLKVSAGR